MKYQIYLRQVRSWPCLVAWVSTVFCTPCLSQTVNVANTHIPSVLTASKIGIDHETLSISERLMRLQPLAKAGRSQAVVSTAADFLKKIALESRRQDFLGKGLSFELKGVGGKTEIVHEWPINQRLYQYLLNTAEGNHLYISCAENTVYLCDQKSALKMAAIGMAKDLRAKIIKGGEWMLPSKQLQMILSEFLDRMKQSPVWDKNGELVLRKNKFRCVFAKDVPNEVWIVEEVQSPAGRINRHYLLPIKQVELIVESFFADTETFIQFADETEALFGY